MADNLTSAAYAAKLAAEDRKRIEAYNKSLKTHKELTNLPPNLAKQQYAKLTPAQQESLKQQYGNEDPVVKPDQGWLSTAWNYTGGAVLGAAKELGKDILGGLSNVSDFPLRLYRTALIAGDQNVDLNKAWDIANDKGDNVFSPNRIEKAKKQYGSDRISLAMRVSKGDKLSDIIATGTDAEKQLAQDSFNFQKKLLDDYVKIQETKVSGIKTKIQELQDLIYGKKQSATQNKALSEQFGRATSEAGLSADLIASPALFDERMSQESLNISNMELSGAGQDALNKKRMEQSAKVFVYNSTKAKELANDINRQKDAQDFQKKAQDAQKQYYELAKIQTDAQIQSQINIEANALSAEQKILDEKIRTANEYENYFNNTVMVEIDKRYQLSAEAWLSYMKTANISWSKDLESKMALTLSQFKNVVSVQSSGISSGNPVSGLKEGESYDAYINRIKLEDAKAEQARQNKMAGKTGANFGSAFANVPRFASGGVTEGGLNYLHPKEMILNQSQQANLFQMLNSPRPNIAGDVTIMISVSGNNINSQMDVNNITSQISNSIAKEYRKISSGY